MPVSDFNIRGNTRILYIDALRGFAIILMVIGHSIAWQFEDLAAPSLVNSASPLFIWRVIYSFHMPLLMFCSGMLFPKTCSFKAIWKRFYTLMVPFFIMGGVLKICRGGILNYWFLLILFEFFLVSSIPNILFSKKTWWAKLEIPLYVFLAIAIWLFSIKMRAYQHLPLVDIEHLSLFPYFVMGIVSGRLNLIERFYANKSIYTFSIILFPVLFYLVNYCDVSSLESKVLSLCLPVPAIVFLSIIMKQNENSFSKLYSLLKLCGIYSLEIYLIHFFFTTKLDFIGAYFEKVSIEPYSWMYILVPQLLISLATTAIVIGMCFAVMKVLWYSPVLSQLCLGRQHYR